jgi:hypothetical protein
MPIRRLPVLATASVLALAASAPAALAQVTAAEVWENWRALLQASGPDVAVTVGAEEVSGNTLTVRDLKVTSSDPETVVTMEYGTHVFTGRDDGTVQVTLPETYAISVAAAPGATMPSPDMRITLRQTGTDVVVSGSADDLTTAYSAASVTVALDQVAMDGAPVDVDLDLALTNVAASYRTAGTDALDITSRFTADEMVVSASGTPPEPDQGPFAMTARFAALEGDAAGLFGAQMFASPDIGAALAQGFRVDTAFRHGAATYEIETEQPAEGRVVVRGGSDSGNLSMRVDEAGISYGGANTGLKLAVEAAAMPLPDLSATIGESGFNLTMPLQQSDAPQDFGLLFRMKDLVLSDTLWNMADPGSILPRDPATLIVDLAGKAKWLVDIMDPEVAAQPTDTAPGEIHAFDIRSLELTAAGASLTGTGAFTFDNTDVATFQGMPRPEGALDLRLSGGNGLIEKLSQMGLLPPDQVMGAQMILGLFARPTEEPDVVTSRIEVDASGQLVANGQPLPLP